MNIKEDFILALKNPKAAIKVMKEMRQRVKFYSHFQEVFVTQSYYWLYTQIKPHTILLDIGAFIGDTAIYFAMHPNIDKIIAFEPHNRTFKILKENIDKLPQSFKEKIIIENKAVIDKNGFVGVSEKHITGFNKVCSGGGKIIATSLDTELKKLNIAGSHIAIKCDTEGSEYKIFANSNLKNVYALQIEFHKGYKNLSKKFTKFHFHVNISGQNIGYLYAKK